MDDSDETDEAGEAREEEKSESDGPSIQVAHAKLPRTKHWHWFNWCDFRETRWPDSEKMEGMY